MHNDSDCRRATYLRNAIAETLPPSQRRQWQDGFDALLPASDFRQVTHALMAWLLGPDSGLEIPETDRDSVEAVRQLHLRRLAGQVTETDDEWSVAWSDLRLRLVDRIDCGGAGVAALLVATESVAWYSPALGVAVREFLRAADNPATASHAVAQQLLMLMENYKEPADGRSTLGLVRRYKRGTTPTCTPQSP